MSAPPTMRAQPPTPSQERGRIAARPGRPRLAKAGAAGRLALGGGESRAGYLYVPDGLSQGDPVPLLVFLHGAGGEAGQAEMVRPFAEQHKVLVLSIDSRAATWDLIHDELGPDVAFLDHALAWTFERFTVDPAHIGIAGFSDGASYALSLGLANGELFGEILAFSPGFAIPPEIHGQPRVFVSHGTRDGVLPVGRCSRPIVQRLEREGYAVAYREFDGPHTVPPEIARDALVWMLR